MKFYQKNWFIILMLLFIPPVGLVLMWVNKNFNKVIRIILSIIFGFYTLIYFVMVIPSDDTDNTSNDTSIETHIYDNAEIRDVMNGFYTEKLGEYSLIKIDSSEVTTEALEDWYFNYVEENDFNWCMILYTDNQNNIGVFANNGIVEKNINFNIDEYGEYYCGAELPDTIYYFADTENKKLSIIEDDDDDEITTTTTTTTTTTAKATTTTTTKKETTTKNTETYILNTSTGKFHRPSCYMVDKMSSSNKREVECSYEEMKADGYSPCQRCL